MVFNCPFEPEITANYEADSSAHFTLERHSAGSPGTWGSAQKVKTCNFVQKWTIAEILTSNSVHNYFSLVVTKTINVFLTL